MAKPQFRSTVEALAARQLFDYRRRTPGSYFAEAGASLTLDEAYAVQMEVARLRCAAGDSVAGYKVGCIGSGVVEQFGMSGPIHARLFRSEIRNSGDKLQYDAYANLAIEGEMAIRIGTNGGIPHPLSRLSSNCITSYSEDRGKRLRNSSPTTGSTPVP